MTLSTKYALRPDRYFPDETEKKRICLHYTQGPTAESAWWTWNNSKLAYPIGTAYVIDVDGTVHQFFDPKYWSWHLGVGNAAADASTIGIELANWGPLVLNGQSLCTFQWKAGQKVATKKITELSATGTYHTESWRGIDYWQTFPTVQVEACAALCKLLAAQFGIPLKMLDIPKRWYTYCQVEALKHEGIICHHQVSLNRLDMGPAFNAIEFSKLLI